VTFFSTLYSLTKGLKYENEKFLFYFWLILGHANCIWYLKKSFRKCFLCLGQKAISWKTKDVKYYLKPHFKWLMLKFFTNFLNLQDILLGIFFNPLHFMNHFSYRFKLWEKLNSAEQGFVEKFTKNFQPGVCLSSTVMLSVRKISAFLEIFSFVSTIIQVEEEL